MPEDLQLQLPSAPRAGSIPAQPLPMPLVLMAGVALAAACAIAPYFATGCGGRRGESCNSNLRNLTVAALMYSADYDEALPHAEHWADATTLYRKNDGELACPQLRKDTGETYGYAFNADLSTEQIKQVARPEGTPFFFDTRLHQRNAFSHLTAGLEKPGRHRGRNNVSYLDGHVRTVEDRQAP